MEEPIAATGDSATFLNRQLWLATLASLVAVVAVASTTEGGEPMPDIALSDVNSTSATFGKMVSPRDYEGNVSGWYFGHAT